MTPSDAQWWCRSLSVPLATRHRCIWYIYMPLLKTGSGQSVHFWFQRQLAVARQWASSVVESPIPHLLPPPPTSSPLSSALTSPSTWQASSYSLRAVGDGCPLCMCVCVCVCVCVSVCLCVSLYVSVSLSVSLCLSVSLSLSLYLSLSVSVSLCLLSACMNLAVMHKLLWAVCMTCAGDG